MNIVQAVELFIRIKSKIVVIGRVVKIGYRIVRLFALKRMEALLQELERWLERRQKEADIREFLAVFKSIPIEKKTSQRTHTNARTCRKQIRKWKRVSKRSRAKTCRSKSPPGT